MEDNSENGAVHFHSAVVLNETQLSEPIQKEADARSRDHGRFPNAGDRGCVQCGGGRHAYQLPDEAAFTNKAAVLQNPDDGFFALQRERGKLDPPAWI